MSHRSRSVPTPPVPASFGDVLGAGILAVSLVFAGAATPEPVDARTAPVSQHNAILPERLKLSRKEGLSFPDGWLPRPR